MRLYTRSRDEEELTTCVFGSRVVVEKRPQCVVPTVSGWHQTIDVVNVGEVGAAKTARKMKRGSVVFSAVRKSDQKRVANVLIYEANVPMIISEAEENDEDG